jgi:hypothetical protein
MYLRDSPVQLMNNMTFTASKAQTGAGLYAGKPQQEQAGDLRDDSSEQLLRLDHCLTA